MDMTAHHGAYFIKPSLTDTGLRAFMISTLTLRSPQAGRSRPPPWAAWHNYSRPPGAPPPSELIGGSGNWVPGVWGSFSKNKKRVVFDTRYHHNVYIISARRHMIHAVSMISNHGSKMPHDGSEYSVLVLERERRSRIESRWRGERGVCEISD